MKAMVLNLIKSGIIKNWGVLALVGLIVTAGLPTIGQAACQGGCMPPSCSAGFCDTCAWCSGGGTGDDDKSGEEAFGEDYVEPKGYKKLTPQIKVPCQNGTTPQKVCVKIPFVALSNDEDYEMTSVEVRVPATKGIEWAVDLRVNPDYTNCDRVDLTGTDVSSVFQGTTISAQLVQIGDMYFIKICFDFSTRSTNVSDKCPTGTVNIKRRDFYFNNGDVTDLQVITSNVFPVNFTADDSSSTQFGLQSLDPLAMADDVTFEVTFARYKGDTFQFERLSGVCGIYQDSVLQRVDRIVDGELSVTMPTDAVTNWEFSFDNIGAFILRFEFVDGKLYVYDEMRNDRQTLYLEHTDGKYSLEYWDGANRILITGKTEDEGGVVTPLPYYKVMDVEP